MSGFVAIVGTDAEHVPEAVVSRMLASMARRGLGACAISRLPGVTLAVQRPTFQSSDSCGGSATVVSNDHAAVVSDATLYYREALLNRLAITDDKARVRTPSECILAAYERFGAQLCDSLEGDYAFVVWDLANRTLIAGRDPSGVRPMYIGRFAGLVVVASTVGAVLAHPDCPRDYDPVTLACDASGLLFSTQDGTAFKSVRSCRHGGGKHSPKGWHRDGASVLAARTSP